jgi:hypothetical protein
VAVPLLLAENVTPAGKLPSTAIAGAGTPLAVTVILLALPATAVADDEDVNTGAVALPGVTEATGGLTGLTGTTGGLPGLTGAAGAAAVTESARVWVVLP